VSERRCRVLILDHDPEVLTRLQCVLEDAGFDTTVTWDGSEARYLVQSTLFDLILIGGHFPEVGAQAFLHEIALSAAPRRCLVLGGSDARDESLRRFGVAGVVPRGDPYRVLQAVQEQCPSQEIDTKSATAA
jgi:DNA-binding response OmpR family regulator